MKYFFLLIFLTIPVFAGNKIPLFPSGIIVDFTAPEKPKRKEYLLQRESELEKKSLETYRIIRVINSLSQIPEDEFLALIFYNKKNKVIGHQKIPLSPKPNANHIFFIDRNTGRNFQGLLDIYTIPKKSVSFALAYVNKKGKALSQPFSHPDFDENGKLSIEEFLNISPKKNIMLQYEVSGFYHKPNVKLGAFHFVQ